VAEWFKAAVLKTAEREFRGFESLLLRGRHLTIEYKEKRSRAVYACEGLKRDSDQVSGTIFNHGEVTEWLKVLAC
jgi:hypothetical protein